MADQVIIPDEVISAEEWQRRQAVKIPGSAELSRLLSPEQLKALPPGAALGAAAGAVLGDFLIKDQSLKGAARIAGAAVGAAAVLAFLLKRR